MPVDSSLPLSKHTVYPFLPYQKGVPLQVVRWAGERVGGSCGASSTEFEIPTGSHLIEISSTENAYIRFKTGTGVTASSTISDDASRLFLSGVQLVPIPLDPGTGDPYTYIACIQVDTAGIFQVEAVE